MAVRVIQAVFITIALAGWVLYQLLIRKKRFAQITNEVMFIVFFAAVWFGIVYFMMD
jgi:hypothetical protein